MYLSSRKMPKINISIFQFFRNFPSLDLFDLAVSKYHDFMTFILTIFTVIFCSYCSRGALIFLFYVSSLSLYIITCIWVNVRFCAWFFFSVCLFAITAYCTFLRFWVYQISVYGWFISINCDSTSWELSRSVDFFSCLWRNVISFWKKVSFARSWFF